MIAFVRMQTALTDFEVGSVIRTIIEAAALEDDEQYFQMVQLLDAFRLTTASGQDLDDRVEEFGIIRLQPQSAAGTVVIRDGLLASSPVAFNIAAGAVLVELDDSSVLPTGGYPYTVRIGEGTVDVEEVSVTLNTTLTNTLSLAAPTLNAHDAGELVSLVSGAADKALAPGIRVQVPATGDENAIIFVTVESGTLVNGNYASTPIRARAEIAGSNGNVGSGRITEFVSNPPFDGALVANTSNFAGGRDLETDAQLRDRARAAIQALSKGTVLALREGVIGTADPVTGQRVTTANILESFVANEVVVYVDDGTGFIPDQVQLAQTALSAPAAPAAGSLTVDDASDFPEEGWLLASPEDVAQAEILEFSGVDYGTNVISLVNPTAKAHDAADEVVLVDLVSAAAEAGQNFFQFNNFPLVRTSQRLWIDTGAGPALQVENTDYLLNRGTGEIEFTGSGLGLGTVVVGHYNYYTALIAEVQRVIDGDADDPVNYPGIRAAGIRVLAETPVIRRITVRLSITAQAGLQEADIIPQVQEAVESYINGLGIGEDVIVAEIIERAMTVDGMFDVVVTTPTSNVVILENELPVPIDVNGDSLVTVT
jgi:uncharacterized phage protein gp47/JayE